MGTVLNILWKVVKGFLDETSVKKVKFLKKGEFKDLFEYINEDQIEKKYGGTADDISGNFFPPVFPSDNYARDKSVLVNEEKYADLYKDSKIACVSPFFKSKNNI